jgi:hypothetical protein
VQYHGHQKEVGATIVGVSGVRPTGPALCPSSRQAWGIMPLMAGPTMGTSSIAMHALHTMPGMRLHVYYRGCVLVRCTNSGIPHLGRLDHHEFYLYHPQVGGDAWQPRGGAHARLARRGARREPASRWSKQIARSLERKLFPWQHPSSSEHITGRAAREIPVSAASVAPAEQTVCA